MVYRTLARLKRLVIASLIFLMAVMPGAPVFAETAPTSGTTTGTPSGTATSVTPPVDPTPTPSPVPTPPPAPTPAPIPTPPPAPAQGPTQPTGAEAKSYHFNVNTGLWENDFYTWNPVTHQTSPKASPTYSYNPYTHMWDTTQWIYNPSTNKYDPNKISAATPPPGSIVIPPATASPSGASATADPLAVSDATASASPQLAAALSGGSGSGGVLTGSNSSGAFDLFLNTTISNNILSNAFSGNASVSNNTTGGSAGTGDTQAIANIMNLLQSTSNLGGAGMSTFVANLYGNVQGDITLNPNDLMGQQVGKSVVSSGADVKINSSNSAAINNDINLNAGSGNATVANNTTGGNASTGDAHAVANLVNVINSMIAAKQSFFGTLNIYGNLNGDILLPPGVLDSLLASNAPRTTVDTSKIDNASVLLDVVNNSAINNNVSTTAASGNAAVDHNTTGGTATTGRADTNVTVLNLTGNQVVGKDCLLVFVNVLGKWVGLIMNAPPGATAAGLGGGLTTNTVAATKTSLDANINNLYGINNNINVNSQTGNAAVTNNTKGGNATSGNATSSVNLANVIGSQFALSDWMGVLFINVYGTWTGSFGVNTSAGDPLPTPSSPALTDKVTTPPAIATTPDVKVYQLASSASGDNHLYSYNNDDSQEQSDQPVVLGTSTTMPTPPPLVGHVNEHNFWIPVSTATALCFVVLSAVERRKKLQIVRATPRVIHFTS